MLALVGVGELVAADSKDYVRIAERIAVDSPWRASVRARLVEGSRNVFGDPAPIAALMDALESLARGG